ncbi:MAG: hypothetical protein A3B53_03065 [Candidatus Levybacteria bacterium RIFCSPLOWO2_01_FULL_42_15]|nr:MAG: hypothetical protein A3B53_03065 [Candidatus Levybacteria bacterium RIFCSPLOWO2_01_FULL_42_15]
MKQKDILFIFGSTCVMVLAWILFSVYHNAVSSTIPKDLQIKIESIAPDFDTLSIKNLKQRQKITPSFETPQAETAQSTQSAVLPTPAEQSTQSSQINQL